MYMIGEFNEVCVNVLDVCVFLLKYLMCICFLFLRFGIIKKIKDVLFICMF